MKKSTILWCIAFVILLLLPLFIGDNKYFFQIINGTLIWIMISMSINIVTGFNGLLSIAHGGFYGIGAYTTAIMVTKYGISTFWTFPAAIIVSGVASLLVALPALRLRGSYFAIGTLIYGVLITLIIDKWETLTQGPYGIYGIPAENSIPIPFVDKAISFDSPMSQFYLLLAFTLIFYVIMARLLKSPKGQVLLSIKEKEELTESLGMNVWKNKLICFVFSGIMMGIAGFLYAHFIGYVSPEDSSIFAQFQGIIFCSIGGMGTLMGPIIGTVVLNIIPEFLHALKEFRLIFFAVVLLGFVLFIPHGIVGTYNKYAANRKRK